MAATYSVKEIFYTLQGEGIRAGRPAVFCRFAGCNLWTGREKHRSMAVCRFCDTDFVGTNGTLGGKFKDARHLATTVAAQWPSRKDYRYVVLTGGEPLLQVDAALLEELHRENFEVAVETNGSLEAPAGIDWICVSPKAGATWVQRRGHELKVVYPQPDLMPDVIGDLDFDYYLLQPMDGPQRLSNTRAAVAYCRANPRWRLSIQTHKFLEIR
jgi:7-carboxy-7-deazaguanine synthase (Cx14CxxC type)